MKCSRCGQYVDPMVAHDCVAQHDPDTLKRQLLGDAHPTPASPPPDPREANTRIWDLERERDGLTARVKELERYLEDAKAKGETYWKLVKAIEAERDGARQALEDRDTMHAEQVREIEAERLRLQARVKELERELLAHGMDKLALEKERDAALARVKELAEQCNQRDDRITELGKEAACWKAEVESLRKCATVTDESWRQLRDEARGYRQALDQSLCDLNIALKDGPERPATMAPLIHLRKRLRQALAAQAPDAKLINTEISLEKPTPSVAASLSKEEFDRLTGPKRELPAAVVDALEAVAKAAQHAASESHGTEMEYVVAKAMGRLDEALALLRATGWSG